MVILLGEEVTRSREGRVYLAGLGRVSVHSYSKSRMGKAENHSVLSKL